MIILGLNAFHGDSSACILIDGKLVAAIEEERLCRVKHWAGFPAKSIQFCLDFAGVDIQDVDHIAINRDVSANIVRKILFLLKAKPSIAAMSDRLENSIKIRGLKDEFANKILANQSSLRAKFHNVEHHKAHLASAYLVSDFDKAAAVSVDGFGDFASTVWGVGAGNKISVRERIYFPHSLGLFYTAITQFLGFPNYGDEYKVMGLASYGKPELMSRMREMLLCMGDGRFALNLEFFTHHRKGVQMLWNDGAPKVGKVYSQKMLELLGSDRGVDEDITDRHMAIAASAQALYEEIFFKFLANVQRQTGLQDLALAGGCAMNSVANGKIRENTNFRKVYCQPAPGDSGGAIGSAFSVWNERLGKPRVFSMKHAYWGPDSNAKLIKNLLQQEKARIEKLQCSVHLIKNNTEKCAVAAMAIADGKVVGWFQGRMEWGPRALGARSILGDPRRANMKDILNQKIKRRELFRPFAPSILAEHVLEWFETKEEVPFMSEVGVIRKAKRYEIPAVTHVDGSGRLQTVSKSDNELYHMLISEFYRLTSVPIVLNTSFNENEPIVCSPTEALDCFLRTKMDLLVLGDYFVQRH